MEWYRFQAEVHKRDKTDWTGVFEGPEYGVQRGSDQWGNPSVFAFCPWGRLVFFYRRFKRDKWYCLGCSEGEAQFFSPDEQRTAFIPIEKVWRFHERFDEGKPILMTEVQVKYRANRILDVEDWYGEVDEWVEENKEDT